MARPALMERLMQPAKWLFKKELIPLDEIAGAGLKKISDKLSVDFSEMPAEQWEYLKKTLSEEDYATLKKAVYEFKLNMWK